METALSLIMLDVPRAAIIWLVLLVLGLAAMAVLVVQPIRPAHAVRPAGPPTPEERDLLRYADEVMVAADRAAETARLARERWVTTEDAAESAWQTYLSADEALRRVAAAAALPVPHTPQTPAEYADRERYLHRAAIAAHWRGELSVGRLADALAHRPGWDPRRHPVDQERFLLQMIRNDRLAEHEAAVEKERAAWLEAERAADAAERLRREAYAANAAAVPVTRQAADRVPTRTSPGRLAARWRALRVN
ncbi:hypothetical protein [Plantactinospora sp. GCM10030261]|uniref:hypothetical protein n=1 Tax=Plantactinospora sp. GCM10030261 TaxID=3273420 RepID=UPI00361E570E